MVGKFLFLGVAVAAVASLFVVVLSAGGGPAVAQDAAAVNLGKSVWVNKVPCKDCHGWSGNGLPDDPQAPRGANLRETQLDAAQLAETILCGRPTTEMPYFDARAYEDDRCFGMTRAQLGTQAPGQGSVTLTKREADALAAFIVATFVGKPPPTREECVAFWGANGTRCREYAPAAGAGR